MTNEVDFEVYIEQPVLYQWARRIIKKLIREVENLDDFYINIKSSLSLDYLIEENIKSQQTAVSHDVNCRDFRTSGTTDAMFTLSKTSRANTDNNVDG